VITTQRIAARVSVAWAARWGLAVAVLGVALGASGCAGPRYDRTGYSGNQALYSVNPKCAGEFAPCQDGTAR
jgi:hypothetical protein